ncbi:hypothetical protein FUAX_13200 [Fulvitalea axinellae]|uniref:Acetate uptake transporter n=1 Tax=Fulvitalea axinellae TaxID=1182444 RepID=A0AAU9CYZ5_9BACT|nr:hypothetical protein FUAX_13200 [Fulvitalea axinellae]
MTKVVSGQGANPAPLGLAGFGMTTILLNIHNAGFFELNTMILMMGTFFGGFAQIIAGILEFKKNNTFGMVAFIAYGSFWLTLVGIVVLGQNGFMVTDKFAMGWYLAIWGLFSLGMFFGTLKGPRIGQLVFGTLVILFALLAASDFLHSETLHTIAGFEGILCGGLALYEAIGLIVNEKHGKQVFPM